jgi:uncharacterized protein HemY
MTGHLRDATLQSRQESVQMAVPTIVIVVVIVLVVLFVLGRGRI